MFLVETPAPSVTALSHGVARPASRRYARDMAPLSPDLRARYATTPVPRYTSYPSANLWGARDADFGRAVYADAGQRALSLYVHVPFCHKLCFYCGCNMEVVHRTGIVERYLAALEREVAMVAALVPRGQQVVQVHLGGGTPTFLDSAQLRRLAGVLRAHFDFAPGLEMSLEVHPPVTTFEQLQTLAELGFNRLSMGVQDFDPVVQERINRLQPFEQTRDLMAEARRLGFRSLNVDLMYGLPSQTVEGFGQTLELLLALRPERVAVFGYAHMPKLIKHQRVLDGPDLPAGDARLALLELALSRLQGAGYVSIGLDHFALAGDELAVARGDGTLRRNFMGYTTCAESDVLAFGPSSISEVRGAFVQNAREVRDWATRVERGELPVVRGWAPTPDDDLRRELIQQLFCQLQLDTAAFARAHGIDFDATFRPELEALRTLEADGLVERAGAQLKVTPVGQLLLRNVASVFDAYLRAPAGPRHHSTAV